MQYIRWLTNFIEGNHGHFVCRQPAGVGPGGSAGSWNSLILVIISTVLTYAIGLLIGIYGALRPYSLPDRIISVLAYFGLGIPSFFFALLVIYGLVVR